MEDYLGWPPSQLPFVPFSVTGIGTGPPGEVSVRAVNTSTPVSVTR